MGKSSLVERLFAETTRKRIHRGVFKSVDELKHIMDYLNNHNGRPKPYVWTKRNKPGKTDKSPA
jgi:hypothetical protein